MVKNFLNNSIKYEQLTIHNAYDAFKMLQASDRNIDEGPSQRHFYYVSSKDISKIRSAVKLSDLVAIPKIRKIHQVFSDAGEDFLHVYYKRSSCYCPEQEHCHHYSEEPKRFDYPGLYIN